MKARYTILLSFGACLLAALIAMTFIFTKNADAQINIKPQSIPKVFSIRIDNDSNMTSLILKLDNSAPYKIFALSSPSPRLVLDFSKLNWAMGQGQSGLVSGKGLIKQIRYAQKSNEESRLVLDLNGPVKIISQKISGTTGAKILKIDIVSTNQQNFVQTQPKPKVTDKKFAIPSPISPKIKGGKYVIVIDAGHGGHDPGAIGFTKGVYEKNITLQSALLLREILRKDPRFHVLMTRESDVFLPLEKRIIIARDLRADLFISLHADAATSSAEGATVYTLSEAGGQRSRKLLNRDNWTVVPPNRSRDNMVTEILRDLTQRDTKNQSAIFAENIIKNIRGVGPLTSSSHRRAEFFVLLSPTVPAVLLEMGFITDKEDEARLTNQSFRQKQISGVARAIDEYFDAIQLKANGNKK